MDDKSSDFCRIHVHLEPFDPWEDEQNSLAYEDYKVKDNCEEDEFAHSLSVSETKINVQQGDTVNDDNGSFGLDIIKEHISDMISSSKIPNEVEDKPPPVGCELGKLKEKNMMQRVEHSLYVGIS